MFEEITGTRKYYIVCLTKGPRNAEECIEMTNAVEGKDEDGRALHLINVIRVIREKFLSQITLIADQINSSIRTPQLYFQRR